MSATGQRDYPTFRANAAPTLLPLARVLTVDRNAAESLVTTVLDSVGRRWHRVGEEPLTYARRLLYREYAGQRPAAPAPPDTGAAGGWAAALRRLTPRARVLLVLRYLLRYPDAETATVLGTSAGAVRHELADVLTELRRIRGGAEPEAPDRLTTDPEFETALSDTLRQLAAAPGDPPVAVPAG